MYHIPHFKAADDAEVLAFMQAHPFVTLVTVNAESRPVVTQVPVLMDQKEGQLFITGHIMRKTDHHIALAQNPEAMMVFTGPHTYVSARWYEPNNSASTWNYSSVQASGTIRFLDDADLISLLTRLTSHFENSQDSPALVQHFPEGYMEQHMKAIIGFEMKVTELNHVFKLSQNKDEATYQRIIDALSKQGGEAVAVAKQMQERKHKVFGK